MDIVTALRKCCIAAVLVRCCIAGLLTHVQRSHVLQPIAFLMPSA
jgi:hypothetical protein